MIVFLNGKYVPEGEATVSIFDRSFLYGDGLFETLLVHNGKPFRFEQHAERLLRGAEFLRIRAPFSAPELREFACELIARNRAADATLRIHLSRGPGPRGYSVKGADRPTLAMTLHPCAAAESARAKPKQWRLCTSTFRLPADEALARFKTANKLPQIMARAEAEARGADEALLCNTNGDVIEGASSNLFWIANQSVFTPPLASGILPGVTRAVVLELCGQLGLAFHEENLTVARLGQQDGVFLSLSTLGVVEAIELDGKILARSELTAQITDAYWDLVCRETA